MAYNIPSTQVCFHQGLHVLRIIIIGINDMELDENPSYGASHQEQSACAVGLRTRTDAQGTLNGLSLHSCNAHQHQPLSTECFVE